MTPEDIQKIRQIFESICAEKMEFLHRAHRAERASVIWKAFALTGWSILGMSLLLGVLP